MKQRLQKILASAGYGSRRASEELISARRVSVNGQIAVLGAQADPDVDQITVDGQAIKVTVAHVYLALNKPAGYTTTARDPHARHTVMELLPAGLPANIVPVGRLDRETEGLLIFTNDGEFAHRLSHPRFEIEKEYFARVEGKADERALGQLRRGVEIDGRRTSVAEVDVATPPVDRAAGEGGTWLRVVIHEGRKRQVRRMCALVGLRVRDLVRTRVGDVSLGRLERGETRPLSERELALVRGRLGLDKANQTP